MKTQVSVISYAEHHKLRRQEKALIPDREHYSYEAWAANRNALCESLSKLGKFNPVGFGRGDFSVGEDWFEVGALAVVLLRWGILTPSLVESCQEFISDGRQDYLITIGKALSGKPEPDFEIVITFERAYMRLYGQDAEEAKETIRREKGFVKLHPVLV